MSNYKPQNELQNQNYNNQNIQQIKIDPYVNNQIQIIRFGLNTTYLSPL